MKIIKQTKITWAFRKKTQEDQELADIEKWIFSRQRGNGEGFSSLKARNDLVRMEKKICSLLEEKEETW